MLLAVRCSYFRCNQSVSQSVSSSSELAGNADFRAHADVLNHSLDLNKIPSDLKTLTFKRQCSRKSNNKGWTRFLSSEQNRSYGWGCGVLPVSVTALSVGLI